MTEVLIFAAKSARVKVLLTLVLFVWSSQAAFGQNRLEVQVEGVGSSEGLIHVAIYNTEKEFLKEAGVFRTDSAKATKGVTRVSIENLPSGNYALAIFHDQNANERLDTNWIGIPKEPIGFSNARVKPFGPPSFRDCMLVLQQDMVIQIPLQ